MSQKTLSLVLMAAGDSTRFKEGLPRGKHLKKQWLRMGNTPLWKKVLEDAKRCYLFDEVFVCGDSHELSYMRNFCNGEKLVGGGNSRAMSLRAALKEVKSDYVFVTDVARCNLDSEVCANLLEDFWKWDCSAPYLPCCDTVIYENACIDRDQVRLIQTPQISKTSLIKNYLELRDYTDESSAMLDNKAQVRFVLGSAKMQKLTFLQDLALLQSEMKFSPCKDVFVGQGIDIHGFEENKEMRLGGVSIESKFGFKAHSDGDVLLHAVIDALLGAVGAGDIGEWFPDSQEEFKNADSKKLLGKVMEFITNVGYEISNLDLSILAEKPKITPYKEEIKQNLADLLNLSKHQINIKATTSEKMGFIGRGEGVCVLANIGMKFIDWTKFI